ncbi:MAG: glycine/sarcosine/betaine reductase selenoprotein B family protein [Dehalococcoidales bacterium]|jgi:D-proline reductase (dithiol) PrdB|nr:glycine/sarcosine/betaine reductase selenoprotein B family protein [Dehalococcoidales bacterium]
MVRLEKLTESERKHFEDTECPTFETDPWAEGPPLSQRRVALVSVAGIHRRGDRPFTRDTADCYRIIPGDIKADELVMTHISINFDRSGFQQDLNVIFPVDRLRELDEEGVIGSIADSHYSFMGAHDPMDLEEQARSVARLLKKDKVDAIVLLPV